MLTIREATADDLDLLVPVFHGMELYYEGDAAIGAELVRQRLGGFLDSDHGQILIALDGEALGFVTLFELFPGGDLTPCWYVKDLYVVDAARGNGVGETLMRAAARLVLARGGTRIDLATGLDNPDAQRFYDRLGGDRVANVSFRYAGAALARLARDA